MMKSCKLNGCMGAWLVALTLIACDGKFLRMLGDKERE